MRSIVGILVAATLVASCATRTVAGAVALSGGTWVAEDIDGGGIIDDARVTIAFADGRASGRSGCNNFTGSYTERGTALGLGPLAGTRMMCAPALMTLEAKVLAILGAVTASHIDATGALLLTAADGRTIRLRRAD